MSETDPGAEAYASPVTGWIVSTGSTNHSPFNSQVEQAASTFVDTNPPDGSIDTSTGDCLRSTNQYSGDFASANWVVHFAARANTNGGAQDGRMRCRLFRSANADGSSATEITAAQQQGGLVADLATSATQVSSATFNPGAFSVSGEYIFIQLAWERTGAGGMTSSDVNMRIGNGSGTGTRVISASFTATSPSGSASAAMSPFAVSAAGSEGFNGSGSAAMSPFAVAAAGALSFVGSVAAALSSFAVDVVGDFTAGPVTGSASAAMSPFSVDVAGTFTPPVTGSVAAALSAFAVDVAGIFTGAGGGGGDNPKKGGAVLCGSIRGGGL
jgi:hypothetical protein